MSIDKKSCAVCAWRETCQKRFSASYDIALTCVEYTLDIRIKKEKDQKEDDNKK